MAHATTRQRVTDSSGRVEQVSPKFDNDNSKTGKQHDAARLVMARLDALEQSTMSHDDKSISEGDFQQPLAYADVSDLRIGHSSSLTRAWLFWVWFPSSPDSRGKCLNVIPIQPGGMTERWRNCPRAQS